MGDAVEFSLINPDEVLGTHKANTLDKKWVESNTPGHKGFVLVAKEEDEQTRAALRSIKSDAPQFAKAQRLLAELQHQEEVGKKAMQAAIAKSIEDNADGRKEFIRSMESNLSSVKKPI